MLSLLAIENIAVIEQAEISFDCGLNVLTGETGAGKSIVIDAISAILGERTYRDLIRTGCNKASVTAVFRNIPMLDWFTERQIAYDRDELLIQREIHADGKNICKVNGCLVTVSILRELGRNLIQIHGQNDTQALFDEQSHLSFLDMASQHGTEFKAYEKAYGEYSEVLRQVQKLSMDESERNRRIETLQFQIADIERADLRAGEDEELYSRRRVLQNAEKFSDALSASVDALSGTDHESGAVDSVTKAVNALSKIASYEEKYAKYVESLTDARFALQDVYEELLSDREDLSYSDGELESIESRLDVISRLQKKYGATVADILTFCENAKEELANISDSDSKLEHLRLILEQKKKTSCESGLALRKKRLSSAEILEKKIEEELRQLDMPNIQFRVQFEETDLSETGMDQVRFLMSANAGEALKPMSKVASGGELARIMLAMKNVLAENDKIPTLIFDEVDSGVSGRAAQKVAAKLASVSHGKQVFCVSHLPQIAAIADTHLLISKEVRQGRTYTSVVKLTREGRVEELSRILGGADITDNIRKSAEEMLK